MLLPSPKVGERMGSQECEREAIKNNNQKPKKGVWADQRFLACTQGSQLMPPSQQPEPLPTTSATPTSGPAAFADMQVQRLNSIHLRLHSKVLSSFHTFYLIAKTGSLEIFFIRKSKTNQRFFHVEPLMILYPPENLCV